MLLLDELSYIFAQLLFCSITSVQCKSGLQQHMCDNTHTTNTMKQLLWLKRACEDLYVWIDCRITLDAGPDFALLQFASL